ncbi:hypothetical protein ACOMHN_047157 [Nucella lapillus]
MFYTTASADTSHCALVGEACGIMFCGPATSVELRTLGEGVSHVGHRFTRLVLTEDQVNILMENKPRVCLLGPPGVGKTLLLIQKAKDWLKEGIEVHIISVFEPAMAVTELIYGELREKPGDPKKVKCHHMPLGGRVPLVETLKSAAENGKVAVIMDEVGSFEFSELHNLLQDMTDKIEIERIWLVAGADHRGVLSLPDMFFFEEKKLQTSMRTPPFITREVQKSDYLHLEYSPGKAPPPSEGPRPVHLYHRCGQDGHSESSEDCPQCGKDVAKYLTETLQVGEKTKGESKRAPLDFKDVFILTRFYKHFNRLFPEDANFIQEVDLAGIPLTIVQTGDLEAIKRLSGSNRPDKVVVTNPSTVRGLERKVVVWRRRKDDEEGEQFGRLLGVSRCTSQLVIVGEEEAWTEEAMSVEEEEARAEEAMSVEEEQA